MPGSLSHLTGRFFDVLTSKPLTGDEESRVRGWLDAGEGQLFFAQAHPDQRHGYHAASVVLGAGETDPVVIRAALLHDIGKRHARLGIIGRSAASALIRLRLPLTRRMRLYVAHGDVAAEELAGLGCEALIVDFARHHHDTRPRSIPPQTWDLLQLADQPPKTGSMVRA